ncbi:MAG TPA: FtsX-like permease family protein [Candidatus Dormibacteraeota bacterium]|nr:FtsX-like permease family protein [Candidatus Dormibacteraeota bacterium]
MKIRDLTELAARNLREAVLRNSLTTLGIAVGVASLVALLSLGVGLQQLVDHSVARAGLFDIVTVRPRQNIPFGQGRERRTTKDAEDQMPPRELDDAARKEIAALPNVLEVDPEVRFTGEARHDSNSQLVMVSGLAQSSQSSGFLDGMAGKFFSGPDAQEAIVQGDMAKRLLNAGQAPDSLIGQKITLRFAQRQTLPPLSQQAATDAPTDAVSPDEAAMGFSIVPSEKQFLVVGVTPTSEAGGGQVGFNNAGIYLPLDVAENLQVVDRSDLRNMSRSASSVGQRYGALNVLARSPEAVAQIESSIARMGFQAFSLIDVTRRLRTFFAIFDLFLAIFGSLALAVASLGIINTLVMAILERRREIGVLKALGAADRDVRHLFFAEAGVMGLVGGMIGVALGWGIGRAIQFGTTVYMKRQDMIAPNIWSVPWWLVLGAIGFAIFVSLASGIYPASRAAKLDPVEALRYE